MCSIGGFISSSPLKATTAKRLCQALLFHGSQRGQQSAGIYANGKLFKRAMHPADFIYEDGFDELFEVDPNCALVHTRQPTSGGTGDEQAHPFWIGNTITVHNGGIFNCAELKKKWSLEKPSGVDSELMTAAIDAYGIERLPEISKDIMGSAAVAAMHHGELYLMRDGNPLEYYELKLNTEVEGGTNLLVFGSTMSQVKDAIGHCWLIKNFGTTTTLPTGKIFKCSTAGVLTDSGEFSTGSYSAMSRYSGVGGATTNPTRGSTPAQTGWGGTTNLFMSGNSVSVYGESLSFKAIATILEATEEEIPPPSKHGGYGMRPADSTNGTKMVFYNAKFAAAQHIKYDPAYGWVRRLLEEPPVVSRKEKRRQKKNRDRNLSMK